MIRRMNFRRARQPLGIALACFVLVTVLTPAVAVDAYTGTVESANARYVVATYQQLLGRDPDDVALDFYLSRIAAGGDTSRKTMAEALLFGPEASAREVDRAYGSILHRSAEPTGKTYWTRHLQDHDVLDLRVLLMSSDEYVRQSGGTNQSWVNALYADILQRPGRGRRPAVLGC